MQRIRIQYEKKPLLRYTGTLDIQKLWERTLRRAKLPIEYSHGFHPQPKIQLACPLPLGMTSKVEFVDFWLEGRLEIPDLWVSITRAKNDGIEIKDIQNIPTDEPSLQSRLNSVRYQTDLAEDISEEELALRMAGILNADSIILEKRGKRYDLRPLIESCITTANPETGSLVIQMQLSARPGATGRPEEVLKVLGFDPDSFLIERTDIFFKPLTTLSEG
jgi:radical SAM-linked protein